MYDTQSTQSNAGKQSWSRTALKCCNNTEILWKRKHVSLASLQLLEILWPKLQTNWRAEELKTPNVSIAMGWKTRRASTSVYFFSLREAANSAVDPACRTAPLSQCRTAVLHCCKGDAASQWEMAILGVSSKI